MRTLKHTAKSPRAALEFAAVVLVCALFSANPVYAEGRDEVDRTQRTSRTDEKVVQQPQSKRAGKSGVDLVTRVKGELEALDFVPPPRTISDIRELLGARAELPSDCRSVQSERKAMVAEWREEARRLRQESDGWVRAVATMQIRDMAENTFAVGQFRDAIDMLKAAIRSLGRSSNISQSRLYATLSQLYVSTGEMSNAKRAGKSAQLQASRSSGGSVHVHKRKVFQAVGRASVALAEGDVGQSERALRDVMKLASWWNIGMAGDASTNMGRVSSQLVVNLTRQGRLVEAELLARRCATPPPFTVAATRGSAEA